MSEYPFAVIEKAEDDSEDDRDTRYTRKVGAKIVKREAPDHKPADKERAWLNPAENNKAEKKPPEAAAKTEAEPVKPTETSQETMDNEDNAHAVKVFSKDRQKELPAIEAIDIAQAKPEIAPDLAVAVWYQEAAKNG